MTVPDYRAGLIVVAAVVGGSVFAEAGPPTGTTRSTVEPVLPVAVFGSDDRVALPAHLKPYQRALGVIFNTRSRSVCTAFCVAEQVVATAGHCLFKTRGETPPRLEEFWFARDYDRTRDYARIAGHASRAAAQNVIAGSTTLSTSPPIDATSDWALVRLAKPVCTKGVFDVAPATQEEIAAASASGKVFQIAYHRDFQPWRPAYSTSCLIRRDYGGVDDATLTADFSKPETLLLHTCDTGGASSGSPLLMETASGPKVIGINVGTYVQSKVIMRGGQTVQRMKPETIANTGVAARAFHGALQAFLGATVLMTPASLKDLQAALAKTGHYSGPIDGAYGMALRTAIAAFEASRKLPVTGIASEAILLEARQAAMR